MESAECDIASMTVGDDDLSLYDFNVFKPMISAKHGGSYLLHN